VGQAVWPALDFHHGLLGPRHLVAGWRTARVFHSDA
jgi:hypothetical protein